MKIAVLGTGTAERERLPQAIVDVAGTHTSPSLINTRISAFAHTIADRAVVDLAHLDAAIGAERDGFDAVFVNTFADYGLAAMKSALTIPVAGAGEAGLRLATMLGERFAIITVWPRSLAHIYRDRLRDTGLADRCAGVLHVSAETELERLGSDDDVMQRLHRRDGAILDELAAACTRAVTELEADTIVLGCTCMAPVAEPLSARVDAPVIDCSRAGYLATETLLRLGLAPSTIAYATPGAATHARVTGLLDGAGIPATGGDEACPVCIPADFAAQAPPGPGRQR